MHERFKKFFERNKSCDSDRLKNYLKDIGFDRRRFNYGFSKGQFSLEISKEIDRWCGFSYSTLGFWMSEDYDENGKLKNRRK